MNDGPLSSLFISDLHLEADQPERTAAFLRCLEVDASRASALYILGDLFEAWIGDDDESELAVTVQRALRRLGDSGVDCFFMAGNRDFLLGSAYAARCGLTLLADPSVHDIGGEPTLLMHGDTLCTDDIEYQALRDRFHSAEWQRDFLAQSLADRQVFADDARKASRAATAAKPEEIMDVSPDAVSSAMSTHGVRRLVHGHTHRPASHTHPLAGGEGRRIVLGAWHDQGWRLWIDADGGERLEAFPL